MLLEPRPGRSVRRRGRPALTPLIDMVFILLLFFMLASRFERWRELQVSLPAQALQPGAAGPSQTLLVRVLGDGRVRVNLRTLPLADLGAHVAALRERSPRLGGAVEAGPDVTVQRVMTVLDVLHAAGVEALSVAAPGGP